jgi:SpoVK/Ycf46/Vps4 family AAA+-type ATPase
MGGLSKEMGEKSNLEDDIASLARLAAAQSYEDVRLLLARLIRKYRTTHPQLAAKIDSSLKSTQTRATSTVIRRTSIPTEVMKSGEVQVPQDAESRLPLIRVFDDTQGLEPPLVGEELAYQIRTLIRERNEVSKLQKHGIQPTRSAILVGSPGLGKTLSARWIASQLGKPLWVLDLSAVMSSLLGKTGSNLRLVLDHAKANEAVLLLDEIDAIAKRRSDDSDVGELKRLVTVILQEVDHWPSNSLLLAATNHPELVDPALWRRFDALLQFNNPGKAETEAAIRRFLGKDLDSWLPWIPRLVESLEGQSLAEAERAVVTLRRQAILEDKDPAALMPPDVTTLPYAERKKIAIEMAKSHRHSHHEIKRITGVSRDTIRKYAGPSQLKGRGSK